MRRLILAFIAMIPLVSFAQNGGDNNSSFEVSITRDTLVTPDIFKLSIMIVDNKGVGKQGITKAENDILIPTLKRAGIDIKKDLVISNIYGSYYQRGKDMMCKRYTLTIRKAKEVNRIVDILREKELVVSLSSTEVSNHNEIAQLMRKRALIEAKSEANATLSALRYKAGDLKKVSVHISNNHLRYGKEFMVTGASADSKNQSQIDTFVKQSISANLVATFEIIK